MNERTTRLRDTVRDAAPELCVERGVYYTASYRQSEGLPVGIRRAMALAHILDNQTVCILPGELIVGNQTGKVNAAPIFPEYGLDWIVREADKLSDRRLDRFVLDMGDIPALRQISEYWHGKTHFDLAKQAILAALPEELAPYYNAEKSDFNNVVSNSGRMTTGDGHVIASFDRLIRNGLRSVIDEAKAEMKKCDAHLGHMESINKKHFLKSVVISLEAAIRFAHRYADAAEAMAKEDPGMKAVADNLRQVPEFPARTFHEAIQSYWLLHVLLQIESNGHSMSFGRFDQYLQPYYERDIKAGSITREAALELIECLMIKCNQIKKIRAESHTRKMHGYPMFQTLTIGGQTKEGADASNDISYLTLEAIGNIKLQEPTVIARVHPRTPRPFLQAAAKTVVRHGGGLPGFFNDEVAIPLLMNVGVTLEDARDWAVDGCCEPIVPGKHNTINGGCCHINLLKILEMALNDGVNDINGSRLCPGDGKLSDFCSYEQLEAAYRRQLEFYISIIPVLDAVTSDAHARLTPCPLLSGMLDYRIEYGRDVEEGHGPNYNNTLSICHGSINVGNALYAIKKLVYENAAFTPGQLEEALKNNFEGESGRRIQMQLLRAAKYGNDIDEVDYMVRDSLNWYLKGIAAYTPARGGYYCPSPQTLSANAYTGEIIGATPDGRTAGQPMADNVSPMAGTDFSGATATLRSVAKLDHAFATNGTILNMKLHPTAVSGEERIAKFAALVRSFFDLQGFQVQFNIVSADTLRDAQLHPEKYKNLVVKVAGYSALFTNLDSQLQDQIIARTEHVV